MCEGSPSISVIIPTYNEASLITGLLEHLKTLGPEEIIVADGGSSDATACLAARHARVERSPLGRAIQMNAGAKVASGEVLLFLHADVRLGDGGLDAIRRALRDPAVLGGNFDIRYDGGDWVARCFTRINRWRRRLGIFYGDSGIFCRREIFQKLGGYPVWPILEDYHLARSLWKTGKLALLEESIWVSARRWKNSGLLATVWIWFWIQGLYLAGVSPRRLAKMYRNVR